MSLRKKSVKSSRRRGSLAKIRGRCIILTKKKKKKKHVTAVSKGPEKTHIKKIPVLGGKGGRNGFGPGDVREKWEQMSPRDQKKA